MLSAPARARRVRGQMLIFFALIVVVLIMLAGLVIDITVLGTAASDARGVAYFAAHRGANDVVRTPTGQVVLSGSASGTARGAALSWYNTYPPDAFGARVTGIGASSTSREVVVNIRLCYTPIIMRWASGSCGGIAIDVTGRNTMSPLP